MNAKQSKANLQIVHSEPVCPLCDQSGVAVSRIPLSFNYGSGKSMVELTVNAPMYRCENCEFEYLDDVAENLKHEAICCHLGVLSPVEIRHIRKEFNMTRAKFAQLTGLGEATLNRWENGLSIQTYAYDRYLRLLTKSANRRFLEDFMNADSPSQSASPFKPRFRVLKVTDDLRKEQADFRLIA